MTLQEIAEGLINGEPIRLEIGDAMTSERIGEACAVLNTMNVQLKEMLALRGTAAWTSELDHQAQNLSIQCGLFNAFIELSMQAHGIEKPLVQ